ncbi:MAG: Holliday junction resolvase RuvX [Paracoccaceae bacterium]
MTAEILPLEALASRLGPRAQLVGLDLGTKTVGVAVSDAGRSIASPLTTLRRGRKFTPDAMALLELMKGREIGGWIVGLPVEMSGREGPGADSARAFARNFSRLTEAPIALQDERLTTVAAERALLEADTSRRRRAEVIDHVAAALILQAALDRLAVLAREPDA